MSVNQTLLSRINKMINMPLFSPLTGQPKSMAIITPAIPSQWSFYGYIIAGVISSNRNLEIFAAGFAPCVVGGLDHISPLCSAAAASPDTDPSRKSVSTFLSENSIISNRAGPASGG